MMGGKVEIWGLWINASGMSAPPTMFPRCKYGSDFVESPFTIRDFPVPDEFTMVEQFARTGRMVVRFYMDGDDPVPVRTTRCRISACVETDPAYKRSIYPGHERSWDRDTHRDDE
jgi:hypothetical protein